MYTSVIGTYFVELYNRKFGTSLTVRQFFDDMYYPLFFDHEKFLMSPVNTPLFQLIIRKNAGDKTARDKQIQTLHENIAKFQTSSAYLPDMASAIGYATADDYGTTSGQISSLKPMLADDDLYASWLGSGLAIGIAGGYNMLLPNDEVLWAIYEGWQVYRNKVEQTDDINNKIDTWNGVWLNHRLSDEYDPDNPNANFQPVTVENGKNSFERPSWIEMFFALAHCASLRNTQSMAYIFKFGQTNSTLGFIQLRFSDAHRMLDMYRTLFAHNAMTDYQIARLYETHLGFQRACEAGVIGLRQLEPKDLRKYMNGTDKFPTAKDYQKSPITFHLYFTWILAMLNNKDFLLLAEATASALRTYISSAKRATTTRSNEVEAVVNAKSKKAFVDALTVIAEQIIAPNDGDILLALNNVVNAVHLEIPQDNVSYFITLLKFKYALSDSMSDAMPNSVGS
jgi:hypothetical protein